MPSSIIKQVQFLNFEVAKMEDSDFLVEQTDDIVVSACPVLMDESANRSVWGYYLCIENNSAHKIQIVGKNWNITDDKGHFYCDHSAGFKGEIPVLEPGECFEFTSTAPLESKQAVFYGSCQVRQEGESQVREIKVPTFCLASKKMPANAWAN